MTTNDTDLIKNKMTRQDFNTKKIKILKKFSDSSIKNSTPLPKIKSASIYRPEIVSNQFAKRSNSLGILEYRKSFDVVSEIAFSETEIQETENNLNLAFNQSSDETLSSESIRIKNVDTTMSDYYLKELMATPSEPEIIDPDILNTVYSVMQKMLKIVTRKMYFYKIGKFVPSYSDDSIEYFFTKDDHLYDINKYIMSENFGGLEIYNDESSDSMTEVSSSRNEFFSFSKLRLDNQSLLNTSQQQKSGEGSVKFSISSEDNTLADSEERFNLNVYIKNELKFSSSQVDSAQKFESSQMVNRHLIVKDDAAADILINKLQAEQNVLHDDFLLAQYNENLELTMAKEIREKKRAQFNLDALNPQQQQKAVNNKNKKNERFKRQTKSLSIVSINKKQKERLELMRKAFAPSEKRNKIFKTPAYAKTNITIKLVPQDFKPKFTPDIKLLPKIKPALIPQTQGVIKPKMIQKSETRAKTAPVVANGPIDDRQKYPRPLTVRQPWGTINHPP